MQVLEEESHYKFQNWLFALFSGRNRRIVIGKRGKYLIVYTDFRAAF